MAFRNRDGSTSPATPPAQRSPTARRYGQQVGRVDEIPQLPGAELETGWNPYRTGPKARSSASSATTDYPGILAKHHSEIGCCPNFSTSPFLAFYSNRRQLLRTVGAFEIVGRGCLLGFAESGQLDGSTGIDHLVVEIYNARAPAASPRKARELLSRRYEDCL